MAADFVQRIAVMPGTHEIQDAHVVVPDFESLYDEHAPFVWRAVLRLGVSEGAAPDVMQEIFLVVHQRLAEFGHRSSIRTWIYGIAINIARRHRRTLARKRLRSADRDADIDIDTALADLPERAPDVLVAKAEAIELLMTLLDGLEDDQREVFVLAELEEMTVPEIAEVLNANVNTIYSRLRAARRSFDQALHRLHAREEHGRHAGSSRSGAAVVPLSPGLIGRASR